MSVVLKDPDAAGIDYSFDWTQYLPAGQVVQTSSWSVDTGDGQLNIDSTQRVGNVTTAFVSGGTLRQVYELRNRIVTDQGLRDDRSWTIRVESR